MDDNYNIGYAFNLYQRDPRLGYSRMVGSLFYTIDTKEIIIKTTKLFLPVVIMEDVDNDLFDRIQSELIVNNPERNKKVWCTTNRDGWDIFIGTYINDGGYVANLISLHFKNIFTEKIIFDSIVNVVNCDTIVDEKYLHHDKLNLEKEK